MEGERTEEEADGSFSLTSRRLCLDAVLTALSVLRFITDGEKEMDAVQALPSSKDDERSCRCDASSSSFCKEIGSHERERRTGQCVVELDGATNFTHTRRQRHHCHEHYFLPHQRDYIHYFVARRCGGSLLPRTAQRCNTRLPLQRTCHFTYKRTITLRIDTMSLHLR